MQIKTSPFTVLIFKLSYWIDLPINEINVCKPFFKFLFIFYSIYLLRVMFQMCFAILILKYCFFVVRNNKNQLSIERFHNGVLTIIIYFKAKLELGNFQLQCTFNVGQSNLKLVMSRTLWLDSHRTYCITGSWILLKNNNIP